MPDPSGLTIHELPDAFRRPVMILAFSGWNDAAESATTAARYLGASWGASRFAEIDPEEYYHFELSLTQRADLSRDIIVGVASEPHLKWRTYCATVIELARRCHVSLVLTLGALLAEV